LGRRRDFRNRFGIGAVVVLLATAACGGDEEPGAPPPPPPPATVTVQRATVDCAGAPVAGELPAGFPKPSGVTYTKSMQAGPSTIVDGYFTGTLRQAYMAYRRAVSGAPGYNVIFDEIEAADSEVAYIGGPPERSGVVALRDNCEQPGRISVHITNRPL
jgi:hypothetical protein